MSKPLNSPCDQDRECLSGSCSNNGVCIQGPDVFHVIKPWLWGVLGTSVFVFVILVLGLLWILHRYQSKKEHAKIAKFFEDNEEFAKYAMLDDDNDSYQDDDSRANMNDSRTSVLFLTTPDYLKSQALSTSHKNPSSLSLHHPNTSTNRL